MLDSKAAAKYLSVMEHKQDPHPQNPVYPAEQRNGLPSRRLGLLSLGDRVPYARLDRIHSRFEHSLNFLAGDQVVNVGVGSGPASAFGIRISGLELDSLHCVQRSGAELILNDSIRLPITSTELYFSALASKLPEPPVVDPQCWKRFTIFLQRQASRSLFHCLLFDKKAEIRGRFAQELLKSYRLGWDLLQKGKFSSAAQTLKGKGLGSTPGGDDFLCGLLLGLYLRGFGEKNRLSKLRSEIFYSSQGNNLLVNTLLYCAGQGCPDEDFTDLCLALIGASKSLEPVLERILSHGSSSGADSLLGFYSAWQMDLRKEG